MNEQKIYHFLKWHIPERMMPAIRRYIDYGKRPGSFLSAIIQNNLSEAFARADSENVENIGAFVAYFWNECPLGCWGSKGKMEKWMENKEKEIKK